MDEKAAATELYEHQWSEDGDMLCVQGLERAGITEDYKPDSNTCDTHDVTRDLEGYGDGKMETSSDNDTLEAIKDPPTSRENYANLSDVVNDTDDEEDIPLANLIIRRSELTGVNETSYMESSDFESSGNDTTFTLSTSFSMDSESTDSDTLARQSRKRKRISSLDSKKRKRDSLTPVRSRQCRRAKQFVAKTPIPNDKGFNDRLKGAEGCTDHEVVCSEIQRATMQSIECQNLKVMARRFHRKRLNLILNSNTLQPLPVSPDGNCFFAAVLATLKEHTDPQTLRSLTCEHIAEYQDNYINFLQGTDHMSKEEKEAYFKQQIQSLKEQGSWKVPLGDCLPLAIANIYKRPLRIFSSSVSTPIQNIEPDLVICLGDVINLAYMAVRGEEHYEGVSSSMDATEPERLSCNSTGTFTPSTPEKDTLCGSPHVTPHKAANYQSPKKKDSSRKRQRNPTAWKQNIRKERRQKGKTYTSVKGNIVPERSVQAVSCDKCRFTCKCTEKVSSQHQEEILQNYYGLASYEAQRGFLCQMVSTGPTVRTKGKRKYARQYHLVCKDEKVRVCRAFFLATLNIGRKTVDQALKAKNHGIYTGSDRRGFKTPGNKTDNQTLQLIRDHINYFPRMESHYSRKDSKKTYLSHDLNIRQMYKLYKEKCTKKGVSFAKEGIYRDVFCQEFNISFFKPKKDQCSLCNIFEARKEAGTLTDEIRTRYEEHQKDKTISRTEKEKDKAKAQADSTHYVATFDLQAVLTTPCTLVGELYYARKLSVFNLSIYSLGDQQGTCHVWDECNGKRGANEIATCLFKNTASVCNLGRQVKEITYYSDTCGGQNRNQFVAVSLLYSISVNPTLNVINHKFLTSGHSQMECDSIHSAIETAKKRTQVYAPAQWSTVICLARGGKRYVTVPMKFGDVMDFKEYSKKAFANLKVSSAGERINWLKIKWLKVCSESQKSIFVNYGFNPTEFKEIKLTIGTRRKSQCTSGSLIPHSAYTSKLPISAAKKQDLLKLCEKEIIPEDFHAYYKSLPTAEACVDRLPAPGSDEESDE